MVAFTAMAQEEPDQSLPPIAMLQSEDGEPKTIYELTNSAHYFIYSQQGALIDSGYAQYIDFTEYDGGTYFIRYDGKNEVFTKRAPEASNATLVILLASFAALVLVLLLLYGVRLKRHKKEQARLLAEIKVLKSASSSSLDPLIASNKAALDRAKIEAVFEHKLNESDWKIIDELLEHPSISNKALADKVALSIEGTRSSLKKMYRMLEIPSSRNMRLTLVIKLVQLSNEPAE